jgi:hypothetical protein
VVSFKEKAEDHLMGSQPQESQPSPAVPKELAGKWIAWDHEGTTIVASGETLSVVREAAERAGESQPRFEKVPRADVRIIGAAR